MSDSQAHDTTSHTNELSSGLREAVEQVQREPWSAAALERALDRARQLDGAAVSIEAEPQKTRLGHSSLPRGRSRFLHSSGRLKMITRSTVGILAVAGLAGLAVWLTPGGGVAFADVQRALNQVRSVTFDATSQLPGQDAIKSRVLVLGAERVRVELPGGDYLVFDSAEATLLHVRPQEQRAVVTSGLSSREEEAAAGMYETLRTMRARAEMPLPGKTIDRIEALGLLISDDQRTLRVWIDPATELPLHIEATYRRPDGTEFVETASNFVFDKPLDESLFRLDPPAGYAVENRTLPGSSEEAAGRLVVTPKVGLGPVRFGMTRDEVIESLGRPDDTQSSRDGGVTLRYDSRGFWIGLGPDGKLRQIDCHAHPDEAAPVARTFAGKTAEGIALGASRNDISRAYGPPNSEHQNDTRFGQHTRMDYWDLGLTFLLRDDALEEISVSASRQMAQQ